MDLVVAIVTVLVSVLASVATSVWQTNKNIRAALRQQRDAERRQDLYKSLDPYRERLTSLMDCVAPSKVPRLSAVGDTGKVHQPEVEELQAIVSALVGESEFLSAPSFLDTLQRLSPALVDDTTQVAEAIDKLRKSMQNVLILGTLPRSMSKEAFNAQLKEHWNAASQRANANKRIRDMALTDNT